MHMEVAKAYLYNEYGVVPALLSLKVMYEFRIKIANPQLFRDRLYAPVFGQEKKFLLFGERE
jgi:hypothetical protein